MRENIQHLQHIQHTNHQAKKKEIIPIKSLIRKDEKHGQLCKAVLLKLNLKIKFVLLVS